MLTKQIGEFEWDVEVIIRFGEVIGLGHEWVREVLQDSRAQVRIPEVGRLCQPKANANYLSEQVLY